MSDCGVCLDGGDFDGAPEFYNSDVRRARKQHSCGECRRPIFSGEQYEQASGKYDGDFFAFRTCMDCMNIRNALSCDGGYIHGQLWDQMDDFGFQNMTTVCVQKVATTSAKEYLIARWQRWKGLIPPTNTTPAEAKEKTR